MATKVKEGIIKLSQSKGKNRLILLVSVVEIILIMLSTLSDRLDKIMFPSLKGWISLAAIWFLLEAIGKQEEHIVRKKSLLYCILGDMDFMVICIGAIICIAVEKFSYNLFLLNDLEFVVLLIVISIVMFLGAAIISKFFKKKLSS